MSRRQRKRAIERANTPGMQQQQGSMLTISPQVLQAILMQQSPQKSTEGEAMLPGAPLTPYKGIIPKSGPRQFSFPIGYNIGYLSRSMQADTQDIPTFQQLRNFARAYDGIQLCERVWLDMLMKLQLQIKPRPELLADGDDEDDSKYQKDITKYRQFFEKPDGQHELHEWLRMAVTDQIELDALALYMRPTRGGDLFGIDILDGSTIKPLLDDRGRIPEPPYPAYQQYLYAGLPGALLTSEQLLYIRESPRTDTPYGISRIERIIMRIRQALRKQSKDMAYFTDGNIPPGFLQLPQTETEWTSDEVAAYQQMFDSLLAGNDPQRSRVRVVPPGTSYSKLDEPLISTDFDKFLLNVSVASFGLSMGDIGFTEDVNRSSGDSQENMTYRRTVQPIITLYGQIFTQILREYFDEDRFIVSFGGFDEAEDLGQQATAYTALVNAGIVSPSDAARAMKQPVHFEIGPLIITKDGPMLLEDFADPEFRAAQKAAQLAGFKQASNPQPATAPGGTGQAGTGDATSSSAETNEEASGDEEEESTLEDEAQEQDISDKIAADPDEPFSALERFDGEEFLPEEDGEMVERHTPGGHDHDQKTHGDFSHPSYGAKHDTSPQAKQNMAATAKAQPQLQAAEAKVTSAQAKVKAAQTALHSAAKADKPAARTALKQARATLHQARQDVHALKEKAKQDRQALIAQQKAARAKVAAEKKDAAAKTKAEKAKTAEKTKDEKAQAKEKAQKLATEKKVAAAKAKAQAAKAHLEKQAAAAKAKADRMALAAQKKAATTTQAKGAKTSTKGQKTQAPTGQQSAKVQAKAAKQVQSLTHTIATKATLYQALAGRKVSKTWSAQDAQAAQSVASDLHSLVQAVNGHEDESDATALMQHLTQSIGELQGQHGITQAQSDVLEKLASHAQQQLSRSAEGDDYYDEWDEYDEEELFEEDEEESTEEQRYTVGELVQLLQQQMQTQTTSQEDGEDTPRSEEERVVAPTDSLPTTKDKAASSEYRRWKERAIADVKADRDQRGFTTTLIPEQIHQWISRELASCITVEEVRSVFNVARSMETQQRESVITSKEDLAKSVHEVFAQVVQRGQKVLESGNA